MTASVNDVPACAFDPARFLFPDASASPAVGVGHDARAALVSVSIRFPCAPEHSESSDRGVGQFSRRAIPSSDGRPAVAYLSRPSPGQPLFAVPYVCAVGVGHEVGAANTARGN